jgi:hypothetical protein
MAKTLMELYGSKLLNTKKATSFSKRSRLIFRLMRLFDRLWKSVEPRLSKLCIGT